jgi:hypothetical protein
MDQLKREIRVMTPEEAELEDRLENLKRTPDERVQALLELRNYWIPADQRRIARTIEFVELPRP